MDRPIREGPRHFPKSLTPMSDINLSSFIWSVADLLRGDYKQSEYGKVILPFTVLRRLDCVLEATKADVLTELKKRTKAGVNQCVPFWNTLLGTGKRTPPNTTTSMPSSPSATG